MLGFSFSWLTAWGASCFERWCADGVGKEGKGREHKGQEWKGRERKGKEGTGRKRKGKDGKGRERKGKNKMQPTNPNAHTYVNGDDVETHGYAVTQNAFLQ